MITSPKKAIANHCKGCAYDPQDVGSWRQQVEACTITICDLYDHRPITAKSRRLRQENYLASLTHDQRELIETRHKMLGERLTKLNVPAIQLPPTTLGQ